MMLTLKEYKEQHKLTNSALAELIGVSRETPSKYLEGHSCVRNKGQVMPKLKELGIVPPGMEKDDYEKSLEFNGALTLKEYYERNNLTLAQLAELLGTKPVNLSAWMNGRRVDFEMHNKMKKLGIEHPYYTHKGSSRSSITKKDSVKNDEKKSSQVLKEFQIYAMKEFGNTIVAKRFGANNIIEEFKKLGFKVSCREFENYEYDEYGTHFVVEKI